MQPPTDQDVSRLFQRALALHRSGALPDAEELYRRVLAQAPDHLPALANRGAALRDLGRPAEALQSYDRALAQRPDHAPTWNNRGVALIDLGREDEAVASFDRALSFQPAYVEALNNKGRALAQLGRPATGGPLAGDAQAALAAFDRATALNPTYAEAYDNKGLLLFELGRFEQAARAIEHAIRLSPSETRFYYHLTEVRTLEPDDPRVLALKAMIDQPGRLDRGDEILAHFALGAVHDRQGDPAAAFEHWRRGNELRRSQIPYDEAGALAQLERIRQAWTPEAMQAAGHEAGPGPTPVFIVGMPRSGSTLVEQILASHPHVFTIGEADTFRQALREVGGEAPDRAVRMTPPARRALGAEYLRIASPPPRARAVADKRLDNYLYAGLIRLALPRARIVHVRRDPRDAGLSCFSKLFGDDLPYAFDLGELGRYWRGYEALMDHWRKVLPRGAMIEIDYEALVDDLELQTRRILAHCGLPWDKACLAFHETARRIPTASAMQVRRPLYPDAVGRWRRYAPWLGPLLEGLGPAAPQAS